MKRRNPILPEEEALVDNATRDFYEEDKRVSPMAYQEDFDVPEVLQFAENDPWAI